MKLLGLTYFSHIVCPFSFCPPIAAVEQTGRSEKIASGSFYFPSEIVLTFKSLEGHTSSLHSRPSQMNIDTFVIALGKESLVRAEGEEESRFPGLRDLILPLSQQKQREQGDKAALGKERSSFQAGF